MDGPGMDKIEKIRKRQTARLLGHLETTGQLTSQLRSDILRSLGYVFEDITEVLNKKQGDVKDERNSLDRR